MSHPRQPNRSEVAPRDGDPTSTGDEPLNRLAAAIRRISAVAVGHPVPDRVIARAAEQLAEIAETLEGGRDHLEARHAQPNLAGHPQDFFPSSPIIGFANPIAPPVEVWLGESEDGQAEIRGRVTFDYQYEGPPTCVHGGVIAELFDELMGAANVIADKPAMTGTLTVRYRRPTPLLAPLDLVARFVRSEGRKVHTWAAIYHEGALMAEANGLFIQVQPGHMLDAVSDAFARSIAENAAD